MISEKYYAIIGKRAILEKYGLAIRTEAQKNYKKKLEEIAQKNGYDIKEIYATSTAEIIEDFIQNGKIQLKN